MSAFSPISIPEIEGLYPPPGNRGKRHWRKGPECPFFHTFFPRDQATGSHMTQT